MTSLVLFSISDSISGPLDRRNFSDLSVAVESHFWLAGMGAILWPMTVRPPAERSVEAFIPTGALETS